MSVEHQHHHSHHHGPADAGRAFAIGIMLNVVFIVVEILYGFAANSLALLADAGHNVSDVLGLFAAWGAMALARKKPSGRYTYGLQSSSILAAMFNGLLLMVACGGIGWEAIKRFSQPEASAGVTMMAVASAGVAINGITAWLFMAGRKHDLNLRGAFLHMAADAAISLGVVVSGLLMMLTGWLWLDPLVSLVIAAVIVAGTWGLLRDSIDLALHATPPHIDAQQVQARLAGLAGVSEVHDLHIWAMSTTETALSAHLLMQGGHPGDVFLKDVALMLKEEFRIGHATIQIELGDGSQACDLASPHVI